MKKSLIQSIYTAVQEGLQEDYQFYTSSRMLLTSNSKCALRWDIINTNLDELVKSSSVEVAIASSGFWKFALILDSDEDILYSLMNIKHYNDIVLNPVENAPLYMKALVKLNNDLGVVEPTLFPIEDSNEKLHEILNNLCHSFSSKKDFSSVHYNIITFATDSFDNVIDLSLKVLDRDLNELDSIDLLDSVSPVYSNVIEQSTFEYETETGLKLKPKAEDRIGEKSKIALKKETNLSEKNA